MKKIFFISLFSLFFLSFNLVFAQDIEIKTVKVSNYQSFFDQEFSVSIDSYADDLLTVKKFNTDFRWPWNFKSISPVYEFDLTKNTNTFNGQSFGLEIKYQTNNPYLKQIFFWDNNVDMWRPLPSIEDFNNKVVRARIHLPYARVALFYQPNVLAAGEASWYRFKSGFFAASPDFPRDSIIRVRNINNDNYVDVVINDYGPNRQIFPNRVIDLDLVAFREIANPQEGLIDVHLEPLFINTTPDNHVFQAQRDTLDLNAHSFIITTDNHNEIIAQKNSVDILPIASLTKLLAAKVFLDTKPNLERVVHYLNEDELFNHQFVSPWESAKLRLNNRESLTIRDLLFSSLIISANNSLETLVRVSGLSRNEFISRMNIYAQTWGANNSKFVEPTGLSKDNVSTVLDYAIIVNEVLKDDLIKEIINTRRYPVSIINSQRTLNLNSNNHLIRNNYSDLIGSKTGFINASGFCLFSRFKIKDKYYNIITLNSSTRENSFNDHIKARDYLIQTLN